jgi:hypothetical protein
LVKGFLFGTGKRRGKTNLFFIVKKQKRAIIIRTRRRLPLERNVKINKKISRFALLLFLLLGFICPSGVLTAKTSYVVPPVLYANTTVTQSKTFVWNYGKDNYTWKIQVPAALLKADRTKSAYVAKFFNSSGNIQQQMLTASSSLMQTMIKENYRTAPSGAFLAWTQEPNDVYYVKKLALSLNTAAKKAGYDYFHEAEFILSFIGTAIPYKTTAVPQLPAQTLWDRGDCKAKAILYASLLEGLGYKVAFFAFPPITGVTAGHEAVGIAFTDKQMTQTAKFSGTSVGTYYSKNGKKYYFAETTSHGWLLGEKDALLPDSALVYPLN